MVWIGEVSFNDRRISFSPADPESLSERRRSSLTPQQGVGGTRTAWQQGWLEATGPRARELVGPDVLPQSASSGLPSAPSHTTGCLCAHLCAHIHLVLRLSGARGTSKQRASQDTVKN